MKAIKWSIIILFVGLPSVLSFISFIILPSEIIKLHPLILPANFYISTFCVIILCINNAKKFDKWFESKLK